MSKSLLGGNGFTMVELLVAMVIVLVALLGLLESVSIVTETNMKNQLRDEAVQIGEKELNTLILSDLAGTALDNYSTRVTSSLRGVDKQYIVKGTRRLASGTDSKQVTVRVVWVHKNYSTAHVVSVVKSISQI